MEGLSPSISEAILAGRRAPEPEVVALNISIRLRVFKSALEGNANRICWLGVAVDEGFDFMSLAVNRIPGEAVGGLATLVRGESALTLNVEYNQLDPLLRASSSDGSGDVNDPATGFSPYPGNINQLIVKLEPYEKQLSKTGGAIDEFVNPKYKDSSKTAFKSPEPRDYELTFRHP